MMIVVVITIELLVVINNCLRFATDASVRKVGQWVLDALARGEDLYWEVDYNSTNYNVISENTRFVQQHLARGEKFKFLFETQGLF